MKHLAIILAAFALLSIVVAAPGASARDTPRIVDGPAFGFHGWLVLHHKLHIALEQNRKQAATIKAFATSSRRVMKKLSAERAAKAELCASNAELEAAPGDLQALVDAYCGSSMHAIEATTGAPASAIADRSAETPDAATPADPARTSPPDPPAATPRASVPDPPEVSAPRTAPHSPW